MKKSAGKCGEKGGICGKKKIKSKTVEKKHPVVFEGEKGMRKRKSNFFDENGQHDYVAYNTKNSGK